MELLERENGAMTNEKRRVYTNTSAVRKKKERTQTDQQKMMER